MYILDGIILGIVQGLSEFLPISSSGHLILAREILGINVSSGLAMDAVLHLVTALAIIVYFNRDISRLAKSAVRLIRKDAIPHSDRIQIIGIVIATLPAVFVGVLLESQIETVFRDATLVAAALIGGACIMAAAEWAARRVKPAALSMHSAAAIGFFQTLALIPGMSRSGMAIAGGLIAGLTRADAARFAFLIGIPLFLGAGGKKALDLAGDSAAPDLLIIGVAALAAFASGLAAIHLLLKFLRSHSLAIFIGYRLVLAALVLVLL